MTFTHFSHNGQLKPLDQAVVPLNDLEYSYGFGVYENIRVGKGKAYFLTDHCQRLMNSAGIIELEHPFSGGAVQSAIIELIKANAVDTCNIKVLLIGGQNAESANLYIFCLNPLFIDRKLYQAGAHAITVSHVRPYPQAKTLNMLPSYLALRQARAAGAHDALFINQKGCITEGTRSNFLALKDRTLVSPPAGEILSGVTRKHVLQVAEKSGFQIVEQDIKLVEVQSYDAVFLTSTSAKILPLSSMDEKVWQNQPLGLKDLIRDFDAFLASSTRGTGSVETNSTAP